MSTFTVIVQNQYPNNRLGEVSAGLQFFRSIGATVGLAVFGTILNNQFASALTGNLPDQLQDAGDRPGDRRAAEQPSGTAVPRGEDPTAPALRPVRDRRSEAVRRLHGGGPAQPRVRHQRRVLAGHPHLDRRVRGRAVPQRGPAQAHALPSRPVRRQATRPRRSRCLLAPKRPCHQNRVLRRRRVIVRRPSWPKTLDQIGIVLLISGVVMAMGVSTVGGIATWLQISRSGAWPDTRRRRAGDGADVPVEGRGPLAAPRLPARWPDETPLRCRCDMLAQSNHVCGGGRSSEDHACRGGAHFGSDCVRCRRL